MAGEHICTNRRQVPKTGCLLRRTEDRAKTESFETPNIVFTNLGTCTYKVCTYLPVPEWMKRKGPRGRPCLTKSLAKRVISDGKQRKLLFNIGLIMPMRTMTPNVAAAETIDISTWATRCPLRSVQLRRAEIGWIPLVIDIGRSVRSRVTAKNQSNFGRKLRTKNLS